MPLDQGEIIRINKAKSRTHGPWLTEKERARRAAAAARKKAQAAAIEKKERAAAAKLKKKRAAAAATRKEEHAAGKRKTKQAAAVAAMVAIGDYPCKDCGISFPTRLSLLNHRFHRHMGAVKF